MAYRIDYLILTNQNNSDARGLFSLSKQKLNASATELQELKKQVQKQHIFSFLPKAPSSKDRRSAAFVIKNRVDVIRGLSTDANDDLDTMLGIKQWKDEVNRASEGGEQCCANSKVTALMAAFLDDILGLSIKLNDYSEGILAVGALGKLSQEKTDQR